jgi:hypothetical protein
MTAAWKLYLVSGFIIIAYIPLDLGFGNLVWRQTITIPANSVWNIDYLSTIKSMAAVKTLIRLCRTNLT